METQIRHRRLYAFYNSKVLNALFLIGVVTLTQIGYLQSIIMPAICASVSFALFIGYSLWIWIKKPTRLIINTWLSNLTIWFTLYFLIVSAMKDLSLWWYVFPNNPAILVLLFNLIRPNS